MENPNSIQNRLCIFGDQSLWSLDWVFCSRGTRTAYRAVGVFIGAPLESRDNRIHQFLRQSVSFDEGIPERAVIVVAIIIDKAPTSVDAILRRADDQIVERIAHGKLELKEEEKYTENKITTLNTLKEIQYLYLH